MLLILLSSAASYLSSLPKDCEEILSTHAAAGVLDRGVPSSSQQTPSTPPLSIVLYVLCNNLLHTTNSTPCNGGAAGYPVFAPSEGPPDPAGTDDGLECFRMMRVFSELLNGEDIPSFIRERIVLQVLNYL